MNYTCVKNILESFDLIAGMAQQKYNEIGKGLICLNIDNNLKQVNGHSYIPLTNLDFFSTRKKLIAIAANTSQPEYLLITTDHSNLHNFILRIHKRNILLLNPDFSITA